MRATAAALAAVGVRTLRSDAFKPCTSPHSFQGLGHAGLEILRTVANEFNMLDVTEARGVADLPLVTQYGVLYFTRGDLPGFMTNLLTFHSR